MSETSGKGRVSAGPSRREVQPFTRAMIRRYLETAKLSYLRDGDGDFRVDFAHDDDLECSVSFWLTASGGHDEIFGVEARSTRRFTREMWEWCLYVSNEWNMEMRYPKAYFYTTDADTAKTGEIRLEHYTDLEEGVHQELLDNLTAGVMRGSMRFWTWLSEQTVRYSIGYPSVDRLDG